MKTPLAHSALAPLLILILSCSVTASEPKHPQAAAPQSWTAGLGRGVSTQPAMEDWWLAFADETLQTLVRRALANNLDVKLAVARVEEARALTGIAKSERYPSMSAHSSAARVRQRVTAGNPSGGPTFVPIELNNFQNGIDVSWELDIFGRIRNSAQAAKADFLGSEEVLHGVQVTLLGDVARNYADLRGYQLRLKIAEENIGTQQDTLELTSMRAKAGLATELDVARAAADLETTKAAVPRIKSSIEVTIHRLGVLLGREPGALQQELETAAPVPVVPPDVPVGLPSDLLKRRPDVRQAERAIAAAAARVKVAKADYFPRFVLLGSAGRQATQLHDLTLGLSNFFSAGPAISLPLFAGGRIRSNVAVQKARWEEARILYQSAVLQSLEETENALVNYSQEQDRRDHLQAAVSQNQTAFELSRELYKSGLVDFLIVLDAQRLLYSSQDLLAQSQTTMTTDLVALYKALGGGWKCASAQSSAQEMSPKP